MRFSTRCFIALLLVLSIVSLTLAAALRIKDFSATIEVKSTGDLFVTERITAHFISPHHGIERFIQVAGKTPWGERVTIGLKVDQVLLDGGAVPYTQRRQGSNQTLRIGDPNRTITGTYQYTIQYRVTRALLFGDGEIHLYWNVTGHDWSVAIQSASALVRFQDPVDLNTVSAVSYVGYYGSIAEGSPATLTEEGGLRFEASNLYPGSGVTLLVSIPQSQLSVAPPSWGQRLVWFLIANWYAALPLVVLVGMLLLWLKLGKDPRKRVIAPAFEPPRDIHPGAAGVLVDDRIDLRDISAMLVGLAVKGYLSIQELKDDYVFVRKRPDSDGLPPAETIVYHALFDAPEITQRTLSSLEQQFYKSLPTIKARLYEELIGAGFYKGNPERVRRTYTTVGALCLPLAAYLGIQSQSIYMAMSVGLCGLIILAFARLMPRKTVAGTRKLEEVLGLSEYIRRAEVNRLEFHNAPEKSPQHFEALLPYAIALNLTRVWTRQFEGLLDEPPSWYASHPTSPGFTAFRFSHALSTMNRSMHRTFTSAPRTSGRSAWGGRGSFGGGFSGGGFSGGGFGGGGGGGW